MVTVGAKVTLVGGSARPLISRDGVTDGKTIMEKTTDNGGIGDDYFFSPPPRKKKKKKRGFRESVGWEEKELLADAGEAPDRKGRGGERKGISECLC